MSSPFELLAEARELKEMDAVQWQKRLVKILPMAEIALRAVYEAAYPAGGAEETYAPTMGNVTCREAVKQIEKIWKSKN
jgi:hypothetical protein